MKELGELQARHGDFAQRNTRIVVASIDNEEDSRKTQQQFPDLVILSDAGGELTAATQVAQPHSAPDGGDAAAPTSILIDRQGIVRWLYRPARFLTRLPADEMLSEIDRHLGVAP